MLQGFIVDALASKLFILFRVLASHNLHALLVFFTQGIRNDLHLSDVFQLVLLLVLAREVPEHVLIVEAAVDDAPKVEAVRPDLHLVVHTAGDEAIELVRVELRDLLLVAHALTDD